jgi:uncharacterized protein YbjQ (UPF0145 family)
MLVATTSGAAREELAVTEWDGQGLPPVASARMARFQAGGVRTSLLGVPGAVGVESVGFTPVGEVMGCCVQHIGWRGAGCGQYGGLFSSSPTVTSGQRGYAGYAPYVNALYAGYDHALDRLVTEARALGADGVVGVRLSVEHLDQGNREFVALGTAVRAPGAPGPRPPWPFTTDLAGQDLAKLLLAGWVPASIAIGISMAIRHDDWSTRSQVGMFAGNVEVGGYSELVQHVRADARQRFGERVQRSGADGAIVSWMSMNMWSIEPSDNHTDHVAEAIVMGSTVARFHRQAAAPTDALTILPLRRA